jgi:hypothetical protein
MPIVLDTGWFCATLYKDLEQGDPLATTTKRMSNVIIPVGMMDATSAQ